MNEEITIAIDPIAETQISLIDEEKLPQVFTEQVCLLEKANCEYANAKDKENRAREKVKKALSDADSLIDAAKNTGGHYAKMKKFIGIEFTSTKEEIKAVKENIKEIVEHIGDSAEAQKKLAEVQSSLNESQTAILHVQKASMEYQRQIAEATRFVFGLSAYNMAANQSVLIKLRAILSGASEEQMGELAQQQLFLALDQIRNQESIITRINENDKLIKCLNEKINNKNQEIAEISKRDDTQDEKIAENATALAEHYDELERQKLKDDEHDKRFAEMDKTDDAQDEKIAKNATALAEHYDELERQKLKDDEHDKRFAEMDKADDAQDKILNEHTKKLGEYNVSLQEIDSNFKKMFSKKDDEDKQQNEKIESNKKTLSLHEDVYKQHDLKQAELEKHLFEINQKFTDEINRLDSDISSNFEFFEDKINNFKKDLNADIDTLRELIYQNKKELTDILDSILSRIDSIEIFNKKKVWKIAVSIIASISFIFNLLQIIEII